MVDIIIVLIVIALLVLALKGSIKHFKGEGACCGGGSGSVALDIPEKKLENPVLGKTVLKVSGMHCEHCVKAVTEAINKVDGASAKVNLSQNEAVVSYDRELDEENLKRVVKDAGYRVVSVK
ncbi:heavy-metal-associated domain-containing protein [Blautia sp. HCP28S3_G10]|uniref:heavy-metal-associated domain-containing protein n=1 Tax=Blautia sp. HCP28S3_G10 TaxID=3438908 RepID=UPI003F8C761A